MRVMQCLSCVDNAMFQYHGQTGRYNPFEQTRKYIKKYEEIGKPKFTCCTCEQRTSYEKNADGKYREIRHDSRRER